MSLHAGTRYTALLISALSFLEVSMHVSRYHCRTGSWVVVTCKHSLPQSLAAFPLQAARLVLQDGGG